MPSLVPTLDQYVAKAIDSKDPSAFKRSLAAIQEVLLTSHHQDGTAATTSPYGVSTSTIIEQLGGGGWVTGDVVGGEGGRLRIGNQTNTLQLFPAPTTSTLYGCFGREEGDTTTGSTSPSVPLSMIPAGTLVSFVGMVQDVSDSALLAASNSNAFFASWAGSEDGGSGEAAQEFVQSPLLNVHQCYVIPLPGGLYGQHAPSSTLIAGADSTIHAPANGVVPSSPSRPRRTRAEDDDGARDDDAVVAGGRRMDPQQQIHIENAEGSDEEDDDDDAEDELLVIEGEDEGEQLTNHQPKGVSKPLPSDHNHSGDGGGGLLNLPTAPPASNLSLGAIVTLITPPAGSGEDMGEDPSMECHPVRPNTIVECYGIIMDGGSEDGSSSMAEEEDEFMSSPRYDKIPASLARRVLCIGCRVIKDVSEIVSQPFSFKSTSSVTSLSPTTITSVETDNIHQVAWAVFSSRVLERGTRMSLRKQLFTVFIPRVRCVLLHYLKHTVCGGDELAAEYLLIHLCSTTDARQNANTVPVGDVPLRLLLPVREGISNRVRDEVAGEVACHLADTLRPIITCGTSSVNITRGVIAQQRTEEEEACNSRRVAPKAPSLMPNKDAEGCYIASAPFQLPHGHSTVLAISAHSSEGAGGSAVSGALPSAVQEEAYMFVHRQCVTIDYFFNKVELGTDIRALVVQPLMDGLQDASATDRIHTSPPFRLACTVVLSPTPLPTLPAALPTSEGVPRPFSKLCLLRTAQPGDAEEGSNASVASAAEGGTNTPNATTIPSRWSLEDSAACRLYLDVVRRCASSDLAQMSLGLGEEEDTTPTSDSEYSTLSNEFTSTLERHSVELNTELVRWQSRCRSAFNSDSLIHNNSLSVVLSMARALARSHGRLPLGSISFSSLQPSPRNSRLLQLTMAGGAEYGWVTSPQESLDDFHHIQRLEASRFQRNLRHKYTPSEGCA